MSEIKKNCNKYDCRCKTCGYTWVEEGYAKKVLCLKCGETNQDKLDVKAVEKTKGKINV